MLVLMLKKYFVMDPDFYFFSNLILVNTETIDLFL